MVPRSSRTSSIVAHARAALPIVVGLAFAALALAVVLGRVPLPGGDSFGYASFARNVVLLWIAGVALGVPALRLRRSRIGAALLFFLLAAALSIVVNHGSWASFRLLALGLGVFFVTRALADAPDGRRWLLHWLGLITVGVLLREVVSQPAVLGLRESYRFSLVTEHANTLGFAFAVVAPLFLAATMGGNRLRSAWLYFVCATLLVMISFSRAAWLALALGVAALAIAGQTRRALIGAVVTGLATTASMATAASFLSLGRIEADAQRLRIMATSLSLFGDHWLLGIGFGVRNLERLFPQRYLELYGEGLFLFHSHNFYVDLLVGTGVIGTLAATTLLVVVAGVACRGVARASGEQRMERIAYALSVAIFLLLAVVDMPFYHGRLVLLVAVVWAMMESAAASDERRA